MNLKLSFTLVLLLSCFSLIMAHGYARIDFFATPYVDNKLNLIVELDLENRSNYPIQDVWIHYREFSETRFQSQPLKSQGFRYLASVNLSEYNGNIVEYFFDVEYVDGAHQQFPAEAPDEELLKVSLQQGFDSGDGIIIITPEENENIFTDEFLLTASFFQYSSRVDKERTKLYLNNWDVSRYLKIYDDFLTFAPKTVPPGGHKLTLELYDRSGLLITKKQWSFVAVQRKGPSPVATSNFKVNGNLYAESRSEELVDGLQSNQYSKVGLRLTGGTNAVNFGTRLFLSNREKSNLQPINRYTGWLQLNFWNNRFLRFTGGDSYPQLNPFLMNNVFLRGFHGQLYLKIINFDIAQGNTRRSIAGREIISEDTTQAIADTTTAPGTFEREIFAARTSFGERTNFQLGFTVVKGKDQVNSISIGENPEESAGFGTDLYIATDNNRLIMEGSFNISSYNPNIGDGKNLPLDTLQNLGVDISQDLYDLVTGIITVNEYLIVTPAKAYQGLVRLNVLNNSLSASYKFVQDNFHSLGQPFLLRDNKGISLSDNIRLFQNQMFLNLRYQKYENNLDDIKLATTDNRTLSVNVSYFPMRNLPSLTFGFNNHKRENGLDSTTTSGFPEDNLTNTVNFSSSFSFILNNLRNRITLNVLNYNRTNNEKTVGNTGIDNLSNSISLIMQTGYNIPLKTHLEVTFQQTENTPLSSGLGGASELSLNSFGGGLEYRFPKMFTQRDNLLFAVNGRYGTVSSNTDLGSTGSGASTIAEVDYNRTYLNGRIIYNNGPLGRISFNADLINYSGDRQFKDYIITARYDVKF